MSPPTPILPYTVNLILNYISPPSQLQYPLPPILISKHLLLRHNFIRPEDPHEYLCWPSSHQKKTIALLETLSVDHDKCTTYPVRYFSDDHTYAHVAVTSDLRIVFQWDSIDGWKFHDASLMPFPSGATESIQDAPLTNEFQPHHHSSLSDYNCAADDDAYWDAYGQEDDRHETMLDPEKNDSQDEDAYWAQYATVQGSGDSTLPSPLPQSRNKPQVVVADAQPEDPIVFSYASLHPRIHPYLEPPSPAALTAALNALSPLKETPYLEDPTPLSGPDLETPSPPSDTTRSVDSPASSTSQSSNAIASRRPSQDEGLARVGKEVAGDGARHEDGYEEALRESIKGIYRLWMATRRKDSVSPSAGDDTVKSCSERKELFLRIVGEVVQLSK